MPKLTVVVGAVTRPGRLNKAAAWTAEKARTLEPEATSDLINLAEYRIAFADGRPAADYGDDTGVVVNRVASSDAVILASPVYRGSFTGSLKNLLDQLPIEALMGKPVGIVAMGATAHHFLGVDWHLRDVLGWFGAFVAPTSVYLTSSDFVEGEPSEGARHDLHALASALLRMCQLGSGAKNFLGPEPLAIRKH
jgi:FMN reductase